MAKLANGFLADYPFSTPSSSSSLPPSLLPTISSVHHLQIIMHLKAISLPIIITITLPHCLASFEYQAFNIQKVRGADSHTYQDKALGALRHPHKLLS